jgi:hypothetical protein
VAAPCPWHGDGNGASRIVVHLAAKEEIQMAEEPIVLEIFSDYV